MNAIDMLRDDHKKLDALFRDYAATQDADEKRDAAEDALIEIEIHSRIEEEIFYPAVRERAPDAAGALAAGIDEHRTLKQLVQELKQDGASGDAFDTRFGVLRQTVHNHIQSEERELLPRAERAPGVDLEALGRAMRDLKAQLAQAAAA